MRISARRSAAISAAAPATSRLSRRSSSRRDGCKVRMRRLAKSEQAPMAEQAFRYIAKKRRPKEDRRFVAGAGRFVADLALPGMLHVALVASPYPFARIRGID